MSFIYNESLLKEIFVNSSFWSLSSINSVVHHLIKYSRIDFYGRTGE